ncbi:unnamed protein product [Haemonchus placei]|uniref:NADH dehydrogenase subunit 4L n=1 Tax=Haemonchus placei TaxID=6290 RepID=A0A0N4VVY4_HAEPC|nr:unnamed protein product [Haemonchus placei]
MMNTSNAVSLSVVEALTVVVVMSFGWSVTDSDGVFSVDSIVVMTGVAVTSSLLITIGVVSFLGSGD